MFHVGMFEANNVVKLCYRTELYRHNSKKVFVCELKEFYVINSFFLLQIKKIPVNSSLRFCVRVEEFFVINSVFCELRKCQ